MTIDRYRDRVKNLENDVRRNKAMFEQTGSDTHREALERSRRALYDARRHLKRKEAGA